MLRGSFLIFLLMVFGECLGLITILAATRILSLETAGLLIFLQNNLFIFGTMGTLGLGTTYQLLMPRYREAGDTDAMRSLARWVLRAALIAAGLSVLVFLIMQQVSPKAALSPLQQGLFAACILCWSLVTLNRHMMRSLRLTFWSDFSYQVIRPVGGLALLLVGALLLPPEAAVFAALLLPLCLALLHDGWRIRVLLGGGLAGPATGDRAQWRSASTSFTLVMISRVLLQRLDVLVVGALLGLEAAAIYGVVARVSILAAMVVEPVQSMFQPRASRNFATGDRESLERDVIQGSLWVLCASLLVAGVLMVAPGFWLSVFGEAFDPEVSILLLGVMTLGRVFGAISSTAQSLSLMGGHERQQSAVQAVCTLLIYPPLLYVGTLYWGMTGAAVATLFARAGLAMVKLYLARKNTGMTGLVYPSPKNLRIAFAPIWARLKR